VSEHPSTPQIERFCLSTLPEDELATVALHVADCQSCHHHFTEKLRQQRGSAPMSFTLAPEFWFRNDHVDFEQLIGLADDKLDSTIREIIDFHSKVCGTCREDIRSFLAFRKQSAREMEVSYGPTGHASPQQGSGLPWRRGFGWKPTYAVAVVALAALALVITVSVLKRRSKTLEAKKNEPVQIKIVASPTPTNNNPASLPVTPSPAPSRSPDATSSPTIDNSNAVAVLRDSRGEVALDKTGHVAGLDEISSISRQEIAQALMTERIEEPEVLKTLGGGESNLRGSNNTVTTIKLLYPARRVIIEDRPMCRWESLTGASSYKVYVLDSKGNAIATSEELAPTETKWTIKGALKRGEVFSWVVTAVVNGKEIVSPAASAPEMKFAVLSTKDAQELTQLKKTGSHLALGVFYARAGLLTEAEREFQQLVRLNPQSQLPAKLLRSVRSLPKSR
jgi:hypothetical protein